MSGFVTKTFDEMVELAKAAILAKLPTADVSDGSDYDITARMVATVFMGNQSQAGFLAGQIPGTKSVGEWLANHLSAHGIPSRLATKSTGKVMLLATVNGQTQPAGSTVTGADGTVYTTDADAVSRTPSWTGRKVAYSLSRERYIVSPNANGMAIGDIFEMDGRKHAIKDIGPTDDGAGYQLIFIDVYPPFQNETGPADGDDITASCGVVASATSSDAGAVTQRDSGDSATLDGPVGSFSETATFLEMTGGADDATEAESQAALAGRLSQPALAGNEQYYRELAIGTPDVGLADAIVFPNVFGLGVQTVYPISKNRDDRRVGAAAISKIKDALEAGVLCGDQIDVRNMFYQYYQFTILVRASLGYEPDWDLPTPYNANSVLPGLPYNPSDTNSTTGRLGVDINDAGFLAFNITSLTSFIEVGDRVAFYPYSGVGQRSKLYHLAVTEVGDAYVMVEPFPDLDSAVRIYPGGPLIEPVNEAVLDFFGSLGPGNAVYVDVQNGDPKPLPVASAIYRRHPDPTQAWPGILRTAKLRTVVADVQGVDSASLISVDADIVPDVGTTVGLSRLSIVHG